MKNKQLTIWDEIELGLGGGSKFRIILHLLLNPNESFTKYALAKATGLRTPSITNQLKVLLNIGWIKEYNFTPKTYQINLENDIVNQISDFLQKIRDVKKYCD